MITVKKYHNGVLFVYIALFIIALLLAVLTGCGVKDTDYYLSLQSEQWQTYNSSKDIPDSVHFKPDGDLYTLEISMEEGEQFTINKIGSTDKIGYDALFSVDDELVRSDDGYFEVTKEGKYTLQLDAKTNTVTYIFEAKNEITSIQINAPATSMYVGDTYAFTVAANWSDGTQSSVEEVTWTSSNESVATVSAQGVVSAVGAGSATIKAVVGDFENEAEITVIKPSVSVMGVELDKTELVLERGGTEKLTATVLPEGADNKMVTWDSDNKDVATVSEDGVITAVSYGTATVTVTTANGGKTASCSVTVVQHVSSIKLNYTELTVVANGDSKEISVTFAPSGATFKTYTYEVTEGSSLIDVSEVNGSLSVSGLAEGKATIVITSTDNPEATATCEVEVLAENSVWVELPQNERIMLEETAELTVHFDTLKEEDVKSVAWAVANSEVATIDGDGISATVTGVQFGSTVVTATVTDKEENIYTATCSVLVADEFFFIYGYGLGSGDWEYQEYVGDENAARDAELLLEEQSIGLYALTRHLTPSNGFQIIFPQVANYTDDNGVWNKNMPAANVAVTEYYDLSRSDSAFISNASDQFKVNTAGVYTVYLDLTGDSAKVYIKNVSVDVVSVTLNIKNGSALIRNGDSVTFSIVCTPSNATFTEEDVKIFLSSLYAGYNDYVSYDFDFVTRTVTITVIADPPVDFSITAITAIGDIQGEIELIVFPENKEETPVTSIAFEDGGEYFVNVNNGGQAWEIELHASVNSDATVQGVKYTVNGSYFTIDADTGLLSATCLGTATVTATAIGDGSITTTCTVTFYSDTFYLSGEFNDSTAFDYLSQDITSIEGTAFEKYAFTMVSRTYFTLEVELEKLKEIGEREQYGFQIIHLGMNDQWTSALIVGMRDAAGCYNADTYFSIHDKNMRVLVTGTYIIEIDLSGTSAKWTINWKETELQEIKLKTSLSSLKEGESAEIQLSFGPSFAAPGESEFQLTITSGSEYLSIVFDYETLTAIVTVKESEFSEDKSATVSCTAGEITKSITFAIVAKHHLEWTWDNEAHFYTCTDEGCGYTGDKEAHDKAYSLSASSEGHFYACSGCGIELQFEAHQYDLTDGVFDFSVSECSVCRFALFTISDGTLVEYYGNAETVKVPDSVTILGDHVFEGHSELKNLEFSNKLTKIGAYAFAGCSNLTAIRIGNYVTSIGEYAFNGTAAVITWGKALVLTKFGGYSFYGYLGTTISIPSTVTTLGSSCFAHSMLETIVIPNTVQYVNDSLFDGCPNLRYVDIGTGITKLGFYTFIDCTKLETIIVRGLGFYQFNMSTFLRCSSLKAIYLERPLNEILTCNWLFTKHIDGSINYPMGHCYAYSSTNPGADPFGDESSPTFGYFRDWFAGTWHWDDSGNQNLENILIWDNDTETTQYSLTQYTLFFDDKRTTVA